MNNIRNFSIIAHIDHGKSTLSDRILQSTNTVSEREMKNQLLDSMDLERERGITIKMQAVRIKYKAKDNEDYILNLIDTPGHVDFTYEVSRSLVACEGVLLLVDAAQGIEAQTMANFYLALEHDLDIIPVINKIDLPAADPERVLKDIERVFGIPREECLLCSAKTGQGVPDILEAIVKYIPPPKVQKEDKLKMLIYDAHYNDFRGVITYVRVFSGSVKKGQKIKLMSTGKSYEVTDLGFFKPKMMSVNEIKQGEVGFLITGIKSLEEARVGDTVTDSKDPASEPLSGYKEAKPMVFCGLYPVNTEDYKALGDALDKLKLNDASLQYEVESSQALGFGFRCGFLGLLHMEIIQERIEREFLIDIIITAPNVTYQITTKDRSEIKVENPNQFPDVTLIDVMQEPYMGLSVITPNEYIGTIIELVKDQRGDYKKSELLDAERQILTFSIPLQELISGFFDNLKSRTKGYASMDYWYESYQLANLAKVNILVNGEPVDALSFIADKQKAPYVARKMAKKLKDVIPQQLFEISIQGAIGGKIICRENIRALRKNVTAKCYGGDISRKRKLLEKQKAGKKKMKSIGSVSVPKQAFLSILKIDQ
ncbi:elongation factor 4 [Candidatus Marinamargulisbacteria bacterium SCGC AG-410-N11]|nr:elongation factor 4 [Candidatus Marinamargulisbacteria bacterium SCGC AG-410-N11]